MKITVTIISYNQIEYLDEAIKSVLKQTLKPDHLLIIDDCSADGSQELIKSYKSNYPELIDARLHENNSGISFCRNEAIELCKEGLHTFLDGDDRFMEKKLEREYSLMEKYDNRVFVYSNINYIDRKGNKLYTWTDESPPTGDIFQQVFCRNFPRNNLFRSELVTVEACKQAGGYDLNLFNLYEDFDMRIRLSKKNKAVYCNSVLSDYRLHPSGLSQKAKKEHMRALGYIYRKNLHLLDDLPEKQRKSVMNQYYRYLRKLTLQACREAVRNNEYGEAFNYARNIIFRKHLMNTG